MSFNVLVIPEDPTLNGYILKPLTQAIVAHAGKPAANVKVLTKPRLRGYAQAKRAIRDELPDLYAHFHLWLFFPDTDGAVKNDVVQDLESHMATKEITLLCCVAVPEVEIYACAAFRDRIPQKKWSEVRCHPRMKEEFFDPILENLPRRDRERAGGGRVRMMNESLSNLDLLFRLCPELRHLRDRIAEHFDRNPEHLQ